MLKNSCTRTLRGFRLAPMLTGLLIAAAVQAAFTTTVPISRELAGSMAVSQFPVSLALEDFNLFLTEPQVLFLGPERIGVRVAFQAYDHRPEAGVAISETGKAVLSGRVAYDVVTSQVLLHDPELAQLDFDRNNDATRQFERLLQSAWRARVSNPIRSPLPPHPYLLPFRENIRDIFYDGSHINLVLVYQ